VGLRYTYGIEIRESPPAFRFAKKMRMKLAAERISGDEGTCSRPLSLRPAKTTSSHGVVDTTFGLVRKIARALKSVLPGQRTPHPDEFY
jgi:hypothetical protein